MDSGANPDRSDEVPEMAINSTTTPVTEQVTETVDVTVRVPRNTEGTLFDAAETRLGRFTDIVAVTLTASDGIDPRNGATYVTVTADLTVTDVTSGEDIVALLNDAVGVENAELTSVA